MSLLSRIKKSEKNVKWRSPMELWREGSLSLVLLQGFPEELKTKAKEECKTINDVLSFTAEDDWEGWNDDE